MRCKSKNCEKIDWLPGSLGDGRTLAKAIPDAIMRTEGENEIELQIYAAIGSIRDACFAVLAWRAVGTGGMC